MFKACHFLWPYLSLQLARRLFLVAALLLMLSDHCMSQYAGVRFKSVTSADGLSHDIINTIVRDSAGYMWFGTFSGLNRFDGYSIEVFRSNPLDSLSIPANVVRNSLCDRNGNLWIATERGICRWKEGKTFTRYGRGTADEDLDATGLAEDNLGRLWVASRKGVRFVQNGTIQHPESMPGLSGLEDSLRVVDIFSSGDHVYLATENKGLIIYHISTNTSTRYSADDGQWQRLYSTEIKEVVADGGGRIWVGYKDGTISCLDPHHQKHTLHTELREFVRGDFSNELTELAVDNEGRIWAGGSLSGLSVLDPDASSFLTLKEIPSIAQFSNTRAARYIYVDTEGTIWLGMHTTGVLYFNMSNQYFYTYQRPQLAAGDSYREDVLLSDWTRGMEEDVEGNLWIATVDGVSILDRRRDRFTAIRNDSPAEHEIADNSIRSLCNFKDREMLIGTAEGLSVFDFKSGHITSYRTDQRDPDALPGGFIWGMCAADEGVYLATSRGLALYDGARRKIYAWSDRPEVRKELTMNARCVTRDEMGVIWVGTDGKGIIRYDPDEYAVTRYPEIADVQTGGGALLDLVSIGNYIWAGTENGLFRLDKHSGQLIRVQFSDDLHPTMVASFVQTEPEYLWMTSADGLLRMNLSTFQTTRYTTGHGLPSNVLGTQRGFLAGDGMVCLAGLRGVVMFDPVRLVSSVKHCNVRVTGVQILKSGRTIPVKDNRISLAHDENFLTIELNPFDYIHKDYVTYSYKLDGFHDDWVYAGSNRLITLTNVPGGEYNLLIKASTTGIMPSDISGSLKIFIETVYYKTFWFRSLMFLLFLSVVCAIYIYRRNQRRAVEQLRSRIAADLHDDIGSTLSSIRLYSDVARRSGEKNEAILEKISRNASGMIERMGDIVWAIKPGQDDLQTLGARLRDFSLELCGAAEVSFHYEFDAGLNKYRPDIQVRKEMYMAVKEAIHNAAKHSGCSSLDLSFKLSRSAMLIEVRDNGRGFEPTDSEKGNGLQNMKLRMARIRGQVDIRSVPGNGTVVTFIFPFTQIG